MFEHGTARMSVVATTNAALNSAMDLAQRILGTPQVDFRYWWKVDEGNSVVDPPIQPKILLRTLPKGSDVTPLVEDGWSPLSQEFNLITVARGFLKGAKRYAENGPDGEHCNSFRVEAEYLGVLSIQAIHGWNPK